MQPIIDTYYIYNYSEYNSTYICHIYEQIDHNTFKEKFFNCNNSSRNEQLISTEDYNRFIDEGHIKEFLSKEEYDDRIILCRL